MNMVHQPPRRAEEPLRPDYIPASDYRAEDLQRLEKERLWPRVWQVACRVEEIPRVGDFVTYEIFDESILVVRTGAAGIKAFYNVCKHRGRRLRDDERGRLTGFYCRFHGWKYDLQGRVTYVHNREDWAGLPDFKESELSLSQVKVETWAGWVWINQDPDAEPLRDYLGEAAEALDAFQLEDCRRGWWKTIVAPVNWKVVVEAFNEGYHSFATHNSGVNYRLMKSPGRPAGRHGMFWSEIAGMGEFKDEAGEWRAPSSFQEHLHVNNVWLHKTLGAMTLDPGLAASERIMAEFMDETDPAVIVAKLFEYQKEETGKRGARWPEKLTLENMFKAGTDWHMFPNTIALPTPDGALWYRLRPNGDDPDSCVFDIWSLGRYAPDAEPAITHDVYQGFEPFRGQCPFLEEDFLNMEAVHKGMKSAGWTAARPNPVQEGQIVNFHRVLREYLGLA
ncbi:aromatic ring-hydroxylating dioxygenase subunit alpha [Phenylobacterium sp.]|jgi:phenylpropionate dioxygenase-like ring-hydroxylating dioxygenase large terminal subunit|uniref:aromatic ring-hydroxylating oxygenase subunit alpha n=1 Tax=Phenylobacterium sp. TaxID=1871053 RepID=UPI002F404574